MISNSRWSCKATLLFLSLPSRPPTPPWNIRYWPCTAVGQTATTWQSSPGPVHRRALKPVRLGWSSIDRPCPCRRIHAPMILGAHCYPSRPSRCQPSSLPKEAVAYVSSLCDACLAHIRKHQHWPWCCPCNACPLPSLPSPPTRQCLSGLSPKAPRAWTRPSTRYSGPTEREMDVHCVFSGGQLFHFARSEILQMERFAFSTIGAILPDAFITSTRPAISGLPRIHSTLTRAASSTRESVWILGLRLPV